MLQRAWPLASDFHCLGTQFRPQSKVWGLVWLLWIHSILWDGFLSMWRFVRWLFKHVAFCEMALWVCGVLWDGFISTWRYVRWLFVYVAFCQMAFSVMAFLTVAFLQEYPWLTLEGWKYFRLVDFKIMDLETLRFCTFWGPFLNQFSKLDKIIQFTCFIT